MTKQNALARALGAVNALFHQIARVPVRARLRVKDWQEEKDKEQEAPMLFILQQRQRDLVSFYSHYESLVETLVSAAQYGPNLKLELNYQEERKWMQTHYFMVRSYVLAYLKLESEDAEQGIALQGYASDAFQALFAATNLDILVMADDGNMISRIVRTREALTLYGEHLRNLIAREKACS